MWAITMYVANYSYTARHAMANTNILMMLIECCMQT